MSLHYNCKGPSLAQQASTAGQTSTGSNICPATKIMPSSSASVSSSNTVPLSITNNNVHPPLVQPKDSFLMHNIAKINGSTLWSTTQPSTNLQQNSANNIRVTTTTAATPANNTNTTKNNINTNTNTTNIAITNTNINSNANTNNNQSNNNIQMLLNAHNHSDKAGRLMWINVQNSKITELKVYKNNNRIEDPEPMFLNIILEQVFDHGAFGHVRKARIKSDKDHKLVAVKEVLQDNRYRNRELPMMKQLSHRNIVTLLYYYYHIPSDDVKEKKNIYLNLIMEYMPSNLNDFIEKSKAKKNQRHLTLPHGDLVLTSLPVVPLITIKLCMYQIFRALAYIHSHGICHRDIKPNNLLFNPETGVLKICDFGSAKQLRKGDLHVSYICARFYRAPELLFGATDYSEKIDLWSTGVVFSELLLGQPIFHEQSGLDQLVKIISKLGTPTKDDIKAMNQKYSKYNFAKIDSQPLQTLFPGAPTDALDLIEQLFRYNPSQRISPLQACAHQFFDELREPNKKWFNYELPPLFDFSKDELAIDPSINSRLMPYKNSPNTH